MIKQRQVPVPGEVADLLLLVPLPEGVAGLDVVDAVHEERVLAVEGRVNQEGNLGGYHAGNSYKNLKKDIIFLLSFRFVPLLSFPSFSSYCSLPPSLSFSHSSLIAQCFKLALEPSNLNPFSFFVLTPELVTTFWLTTIK